MIVITYIDFFGSDEELEKIKAAWKKACKETEGVDWTEFYLPHQARYHYAWITKAESYAKMMEANSKMPTRDRNIMTHSVNEIFTEE